MEATQWTTNERMKIWHIHSEVLFSYKNDELLPFAIVSMDLEGIVLSEINQRTTNTVMLSLI